MHGEKEKCIYTEKNIQRRLVPYPTIPLSLLKCISNMNILCCTVVEITLTKNLEKKKKEQKQGRTSRKRPILNPAIQLVGDNL